MAISGDQSITLVPGFDYHVCAIISGSTKFVVDVIGACDMASITNASLPSSLQKSFSTGDFCLFIDKIDVVGGEELAAILGIIFLY